ncbi:hypothetical protein PV02_11510 [Methanolobus chelungpuianus]|uniref:Uncharacterized protein n=1 Tax=Methanolobus chelungpuianus TaxID=502115 RepID=A0AAE3L2L7_9EURY|nr:hypothetical protein [Methanolobus chelungpuianus]
MIPDYLSAFSDNCSIFVLPRKRILPPSGGHREHRKWDCWGQQEEHMKRKPVGLCSLELYHYTCALYDVPAGSFSMTGIIMAKIVREGSLYKFNQQQ